MDTKNNTWWEKIKLDLLKDDEISIASQFEELIPTISNLNLPKPTSVGFCQDGMFDLQWISANKRFMISLGTDNLDSGWHYISKSPRLMENGLLDIGGYIYALELCHFHFNNI